MPIRDDHTDAHENVEERLRRKLFDLETINEISRQLNSSLETAKLVDNLLVALIGRFGVQMAAIYLKRGPIFSFYAGRGVRNRLSLRPLDAEDDGVRIIAEHSAPMLCADPGLRNVSPELRDAFLSLSAEVVVPLMNRSEVTGILILGRKMAQKTYREYELGFLSLLANHVAIALANADRVEKIVEADLKLKQAYDRLSELDRSKSKFIGLASHELNTPVTIIDLSLFNIKTILSRKDRYKIDDVLGSMEIAIERLKEIASDLVLLARGEENAISLRVRSANVNDLFDEVRKLSAVYLTERREVTIRIPEALDLPKVRVDARRIIRVLIALIENSIKAITEEGGEIELTAVRDETREGFVTVCCRDTGVGLDKKYHQQVFDKFFEVGEIVHHSTSKVAHRGGGFGIGLSVSREIVRNHGGEIWVESEGAGKGCRVYFTIPIARVTGTVKIALA
ncbi:MAG: ATP-binding protein [Planctomycetes bacterium]|nr:ATP-binding protein [Planctomycetota bacterium]